MKKINLLLILFAFIFVVTGCTNTIEENDVTDSLAQCIHGAQGIQGIDGIDGLQGIQGIEGTLGLKGIQGIPGTDGLQGIQGETGASGVAESIARVVKVGLSGAEFTTIQGAIDSITVGAGEIYVVEVYPGVYNENIILKNRITLKGMGGSSGMVNIVSTSGTTVTFADASSDSHLINLKVTSNPTEVGGSCITFNSGKHKIDDVVFYYNPNGTYGTAINIIGTSGYVEFRNGVAIGGIQTNLQGGEITIINKTGTADFIMGNSAIDMDISAVAATDDIVVFKDLSTDGAFEIHRNKIHVSLEGTTPAQDITLLETTSTSAENAYIDTNHIHFSAVGGTGAVNIFDIDSLGNGYEVISTYNTINVGEFTTEHFTCVAATDIADSRFDVLHFSDIDTVSELCCGDGTTNFVTSPADGDIQLSGIVVPNILNQSSDYGATNDYNFNIMLMDSSTGNKTVTFPDPSTMNNFKSGRLLTIYNVESTTNLVFVNPNGNLIDGSSEILAIRPNGYVTFQKVGTHIRIVHDHSTSIYAAVEDFNNLSFHIDFSDESSVSSTGGLINTVTDSVNSWVGTPDLTKPEYIIDGQNGLNVAEWTTSNSPINFGDKQLHNNTAGRGIHIFVVVKPSYSRDTIISKYYNSTPEREWDLQTSRSTIYENGDSSGSEAIANNNSLYDEWQILDLSWQPSAYSKLYNNGFYRATSANLTIDIEDTTSDLRIGARDISSNDYFGQIGEIIVYSDTLSNADRLLLIGSLGAKWGISVAVPTTGGISEWTRDTGTDTIEPNEENDNLNIGTGTISAGTIIYGELSADPADPVEGKTVMWVSDGTGSGDDGDIMIKVTAGGLTKTIILVDFSTH